MVFTMAFVFLAARGYCPCDASLCYAIPSRFPLLTNPLPLAGDKAMVFTMAFVFLVARGHCPCDASLCYAIPSRFPLLTNPLPATIKHNIL